MVKTDEQIYGLSRVILRILRNRTTTFSEVETITQCSRIDLLSTLDSLDRRGYKIERRWQGGTFWLTLIR